MQIHYLENEMGERWAGGGWSAWTSQIMGFNTRKCCIIYDLNHGRNNKVLWMRKRYTMLYHYH